MKNENLNILVDRETDLIINLGSTPMNRQAAIVIDARAGEVMRRAANQVKGSASV